MSALITRNDAAGTIDYNAEAELLKTAALESSAIVGRVTNADENNLAVAAQVKLKEVISAVEKSAQDLIDGANDYKKRIWAKRDEFLAELSAEMVRVSKHVGDFAALELAKARAAEAAKQAELDRLERERQASLATVKTHDEHDAVQKVFNDKAAEKIETPTAAPIRAAAQSVKEDWEISITNPQELARNHPQCVTITAKLGEIKTLLNAGVEVKGVSARKVVVAGVRLGKSARAAIEV